MQFIYLKIFNKAHDSQLISAFYNGSLTCRLPSNKVTNVNEFTDGNMRGDTPLSTWFGLALSTDLSTHIVGATVQAMTSTTTTEQHRDCQHISFKLQKFCDFCCWLIFSHTHTRCPCVSGCTQGGVCMCVCGGRGRAYRCLMCCCQLF